MTEQPQESISEVSEIIEDHPSRPLVAFLRAVALGALAGGVPYMIFSVPLGVSQTTFEDVPFVLWLTFMPVILCGVVTLLSALVIGLPLTVILHKAGEESAGLYTFFGLMFGCLVPLATVLVVSGSWEAGAFFTLPGILAGSVAGLSWGRWRQEVAEAKREAQRSAQARKRDNPIHDLIH